ncbi:hypothetical protein [Stackebrandtia nassauensis]|uniref:Lipoprotein n=1 Tax=Stackebrandtia nassauensis (strain DSM 44728 / CIP 108903 / NRRL B-16338 / NBRC 102104 / LLR-40K-21) TaxID=446470 RepID=D3Q6W1_STANL|nr:hypothetical protein [Stackebrandtia nassauensis]ADD40360.1 Secreted repeat of unknown function [Stackebrandtia nassauensis DSM 44728]
MSNSLLRRLALPAVIAALAIPALAACNSAGANESTGKEAADSATEVKVGETSLGDVLLDSEGKTLYMFKKDKDGKSACYDKCEKMWPPLTVDGDAKAGDGADADLLGTSEREDGSQQVTYNGMPLYYFAKDKAEGDVNGQGVKDVWYVVDAEGNIVDKAKDSGGDDGYDDGEEKKSYDLQLVDNDEYGPILVNSEGMTLYMFFKDEKLDNASACYKDCLNKWTPLTVEDDPTYGDGVDKSLIGTIEREDGTKQVTYNDWPMYTFNDDANAGDTKGVGFKDLWCATTATGEAAVTK